MFADDTTVYFYSGAELQCLIRMGYKGEKNLGRAATVQYSAVTVLESAVFSNLRVGHGPSDPPLSSVQAFTPNSG
jgi:hypothetical protein